MRTVHSCDVLSPRQLAFLAERLPEPPRTPAGPPTPIGISCPASCGSCVPATAGATWTNQDIPQASLTGVGSATGIGRRAIAGSGARS
jgi:hypothetical protein